MFRHNGSVKWGAKSVFVGEAFAGEVVGLRAVEDGLWLVHLGPLRPGMLYERSWTTFPLEGCVTHVPGHDAA